VRIIRVARPCLLQVALSCSLWILSRDHLLLISPGERPQTAVLCFLVYAFGWEHEHHVTLLHWRCSSVACFATLSVPTPTRLWGVEAPTFSRQLAHRWRWGCQAYAPAGRPPGRFLVLISVTDWVDSRATMRLEGLGQLKNPMTSSGSNPQPSGL
jgi:hypothetical protein